MKSVHLSLLAIVSGVLSFAQPPRTNPAPWADPNLKVLDGLEVWLDATRLNAARQALGKPALTNEQAMDAWYDGSGHHRHLVQKSAEARPRWFSDGGHSAVRFDGKDQHLLVPDLKLAYSDMTIFLVTTPFSNTGDFRGFLALNQTGKNDYVSGLNLDMGPGFYGRFQSFNPEGSGFGGAVNLMKDASEFGAVRRIALSTAPGKNGVRLYIDGKLQGERNRADSVIHMDQLTVGARYYTNGGPPQVRGHLDGEIAEVLVYGRLLSDGERAEVDRYLAAKHGEQRKVALPRRTVAGKPLVSVPNPPLVQMFVPGFTVRQLPVDLTNINNIKYREDGKLVALAYDGNIYLLSCTSGDGLEDKVELFWENKGRLRGPIGMDLTPPGYPLGQGVFVASKGKCSLIVDTDGDGKADREIILAEGWKELPHGVDALGVAFDRRDGSVYFGLGTAAFENAYQVDKDGKGHYDLTSERGTILRLVPPAHLSLPRDGEKTEWKREIVCTGIRFSVAMAFNRHHDLFCTDQEGATWLPNGNPFDELLNIEKGRHYGFPPRHPKHLPKVIDEPSVFDYAPQHQSTCGLVFNEPLFVVPPLGGSPANELPKGETLTRRATFGPNSWQSDAFVCGYSRGKLYRTKLVKTDAGYVAQNHLLACLNMLTLDACISPQGDLMVAVHSGGPDWGSGPSGTGKLYKISYTGKELPQPVLAWAQSPNETRIAFDRPLEPEQMRKLASKVVIEYGRYVAAGDRFESLRPGYQVVQDQMRTPRFELPVSSVQFTSDRRTVLVSTAPQTAAASYAITMPCTETPAAKKDALPQRPAIDLAYDLSGVEAKWQPANGGPAWTGWLPHLDLKVARSLTAGSAAHEELWKRCKEPGKLTLRTKLNLWDMLRPAVQPGSKIDYEWPPEVVTLTVHSKEKVQVTCSPGNVSRRGDSGGGEVSLAVSPKADAPIPLEVSLTTDGGPDLAVDWHTQEDTRPRALPLRRLLVPWGEEKKEVTEAVAARDLPELKGGSWALGRKLFYSDQANCSKCHLVGGKGGNIGPDLSNLLHRDYASVLRDITEPSFAINPDYLTYIVSLADGRVLTGALRTEGDLIHIGDKDAKVTTVHKSQVEQLKPSPLSIMPEGLPKQLGPEKMKDLLTFLLTPPPSMPEDARQRPPPPRALAEVKAVLAGAPESAGKSRPLHIVLVAGRKDHGPGEHDYPAWQRVWKELLSVAAETNITTAWDWPSAEDLRTADVLVFFQQGQWKAERAAEIDAFLERGGGLVYIHYAVDGGADAPGFAQRIGLAWRGGQSKFRHGPLDLNFAGSNHPIARNLAKVHLHDESYWQLTGDPKRINLLAAGVEDGKEQPLFWTCEHGKGRVFVSIPGHFSWTFDDPLFRVLLLRGIAWTAHEPVDRFNELVTLGARVKD